MNNCIIIGRITRDVELRYTTEGLAISNFTVAVDKGLSREKKQEMESQNKPTADFPKVVVFGKTAENCANFLSKGKLVGVQGRIQTGSYDKDGVKIYTTEINATNVEFLEWNNKEAENIHQDFHPIDNQYIPF